MNSKTYLEDFSPLPQINDACTVPKGLPHQTLSREDILSVGTSHPPVESVFLVQVGLYPTSSKGGVFHALHVDSQPVTSDILIQRYGSPAMDISSLSLVLQTNN